MERVRLGLQDLFCCRDGVGDDKDLVAVLVVHSWDEANAYRHKFGFHGCDVHGLGVVLACDGVVRPSVGDS